MLLNVKEEHKLSDNSQFRNISEKIEAFRADEMRKIWISDLSRNWDLYVKYPKFDDWSSWNSSSGRE